MLHIPSSPVIHRCVFSQSSLCRQRFLNEDDSGEDDSLWPTCTANIHILTLSLSQSVSFFLLFSAFHTYSDAEAKPTKNIESQNIPHYVQRKMFS